MTAQKEYFIYLLSCFLSGETPQGREVDFEELYRLADIHDVGGIIATELRALPKEYQPQGMLRSHFIQTIGLTVRDYQAKDKVYHYIDELLSEAKVRHLFVKGAVLRRFYPAPELRTSGDIDVIVAPESFPAILDIVQRTDGIRITDRTTNLIVLQISGVSVEIHDNADVSLAAYFDDIFSLCNKTANPYTLQLPDDDHLLYVIAHLAKHIAYRGAGIRMLMDVDVMLRHMSQEEVNAFLKHCEIAGIGKTAETLLSLCVLWFGTPVEINVDVSGNEELLNSFEHVLLDGGSFGYEENSVPVRYIGEASAQSLFGKIRVLLKMAFPGRDYLKKCYPYYAAHPFLLPVARVNRLIDGLFRKRRQAKSAVKQMKDGTCGSAWQMALINELEINFK